MKTPIVNTYITPYGDNVRLNEKIEFEYDSRTKAGKLTRELERALEKLSAVAYQYGISLNEVIL